MRLRKVIYVAALATLFVSGCAASNKEVTAPAETTTEAPVEDLTRVTLAGKEAVSYTHLDVYKRQSDLW